MKDTTISIIRVLAMLSIIAGHVLNWEGVETYQLLSVGVEIFLFISGYLYAKKEIKSISYFAKNRILKILVPAWIVVAFVAIPGGGKELVRFQAIC